MRIREYSIILFVLLALVSVSFAQEKDMEDSFNAKILGQVAFDKAGITPKTLKQVDKLVPVLKKMNSKNIFRLDCRYKGDTRREQDVRAAYNAAAKIERYLRERHKLKLDLWISAHVYKGGKDSPQLLFSLLSDEIQQYEKLPVDSTK